MNELSPSLIFPRKRESRNSHDWVPAFAGTSGTEINRQRSKRFSISRSSPVIATPVRAMMTIAAVAFAAGSALPAPSPVG